MAKLTESEWLKATDSKPMLGVIQPTTTARKWRLFFCACAHLYLDPKLKPPFHEAVELAERYADGVSELAQLEAARHQALLCTQVMKPNTRLRRCSSAVISSLSSDLIASHSINWAIYDAAKADIDQTTGFKVQASLLRDIFGNPFRPIAFDPEWGSDTVLSLAKHIYESRDFNAMPILADALQDAGCDNDDILNHCRGNGPHVRGCWVVDLVLGKS